MRTAMDVTQNGTPERYVSVAFSGDFKRPDIQQPVIDAIEAELMKLGYTKRTHIVEDIAETQGVGKGQKYAEAWGVP